MNANVKDNTLHMYVLCPKTINPVEKAEIKRVILKLINRIGYSQHYCKFNYNKEDNETYLLLDEIKKEHFPDIRIVPFESNFKRHGKKGYAKRNREALLRSSHILMFYSNEMTISQNAISKMIDDLSKYVYYRHIPLGGKDVKERQESVSSDSGNVTKEDRQEQS